MDTGILRDELVAQPCRETVGSEPPQVLVEIPELRAKHQRDNACLACAAAQALDTVPAGGVRVGRDVEALRSRAAG